MQTYICQTGQARCWGICRLCLPSICRCLIHIWMEFAFVPHKRPWSCASYFSDCFEITCLKMPQDASSMICFICMQVCCLGWCLTGWSTFRGVHSCITSAANMLFSSLRHQDRWKVAVGEYSGETLPLRQLHLVQEDLIVPNTFLLKSKHCPVTEGTYKAEAPFEQFAQDPRPRHLQTVIQLDP